MAFDMDDLVQDHSIYIANALGIFQSCSEPLVYCLFLCNMVAVHDLS